MSVDTTAIIFKGFQISKEEYEKLSDEFRENWAISFNAYSEEGPYAVGYEITHCGVGDITPIKEITDIYNKRLVADCEKESLKLRELRLYLGVKLW